MKQYLKIIFFSCIVGSVLAGVFFLNIKEKAEAKTKNTVYAFQVGVFRNFDNANNFSSEYNGTKIVKDNDLYRVFIGVTIKNKDNLETMFKNKGYDYYIKELTLNERKYNELEKYDIVLEQSETPEIIIKNMMEIIPNEI